MKIAVLGGTGKIGFGLAMRWARAGEHVTIGSRAAEKATAAAAEASAKCGATVHGAANRDAAAAADVVVLAVPFEAQAGTLTDVHDAVQGKLFVTAVNPVDPARLHVAILPPEGSATEQAQRQLGAGVKVVAAFQTVPSFVAREFKLDYEGDVLVCGDDAAAKEATRALVEKAGFRAFDAGPLANAYVVEGLVSLSLAIKKVHPLKRLGFRVVGTPA